MGCLCLAVAVVLAGVALAHASSIANVRGASDVKGKVPDLCEPLVASGYPCEHHTVVTEDGFELGQIRIPPKKHGAQAVFLQHGLLDSAVTWQFNAHPNQNLATILHDVGYDVWMGNSRGNTYSMGNAKLSGKAYWEAIDMDGMAKYDIPANINYVTNFTGHAKITYVGHSQGTFQAFAAFGSERRDIASKVNLYVALAPVAWVGNATAELLHILADLDVAELLGFLGEKEFLPNSWLVHEISYVCRITRSACPDLIWVITGGGNMSNINGSRFDFLTRYDPGGTSVYNMIHWTQLIKDGRFAKHDWGPAENLKRYGTKTAPSYSLSGMTSPPTALFYGQDDKLADPKDVVRILDAIPSSTVVFKKNYPTYGHLDFVWGENANEDVYQEMLKLMPAPF